MKNIAQKILSQGNSVAAALSTYKGLAVMLIDMQTEFVPKLFDCDQKKLYDAHAKVMQKLCIDDYVPLIRVIYAGSGSIVPETKKYLDMCQIVTPHVKSSPSAFEKYSRLYPKLKKMEIDTLFIMGINASACVYETAIDASLEKKFKVITADDVIADCIRLRLKSPNKRKEEFITNGITYYDSHTQFLEDITNKSYNNK